MSMYGQFKTDSTLESKGIILDYGEFRITVARAGGANKKFAKLAEAKTKPFKRAIQTETMDNEKSMAIVREIYAEAVILNWETKVEKKFKPGIEGEDGKVLPFNKKNVILTLTNLPDLFADIQEQATKSALYRESIRETDAKN